MMPFWLMIVGVAATAVARASDPAAAARHEATDSNLVNTFVNSPTTFLSPLPSRSESIFPSTTVDISIFETATQDTTTAVSAVLSSISRTSHPDTEGDDEITDKSPTASEPDALLQIVFSVVGTLLALASVVVAVFFGYRQLKVTRTQPGIVSHDTPNGISGSGSDEDLEMGPVTFPGGSSPPGAQPPVTDHIFTHTLGTKFAYFFDKLKSMCAAPSPILGREGQSVAPPPNQTQAPVHEDAAAPIDNSQEQQGERFDTFDRYTTRIATTSGLSNL